jgi:hypothetical protein
MGSSLGISGAAAPWASASGAEVASGLGLASFSFFLQAVAPPKIKVISKNPVKIHCVINTHPFLNDWLPIKAHLSH